MRTKKGRATAFTLVELLVVIGIIAVLIGILLPVLSGVQGRARDLKCQSNVRQICLAILGYAAEHKGSLPYGFYYNQSNPTSWEPAGGDTTFISWASLVGKYVVKGAAGDNFSENFPPVLQCPEAQQAFPHIVGYIGHMVAMPAPIYEVQGRGGAPNIPLWSKPPTTSGLFPHNALVWDTSVGPGLENNVGYLVSGDLDDQRIWTGARNPQWRFFDPRDVYGNLPSPAFKLNGNNAPVKLGANYRNIDPPDESGDGPGFPYQGNIRFRHVKNTSVNVGFADGHVEAIRARIGPNNTVTSHEFIRKYVLIKWPSGMPRNQTVP